MIRWNDRWLYLPDDIREEVARQNLAPGKRNFPLAPYAFHPGNCPCLVCAWVRDQNVRLEASQDPEPVPDSQRAVCGHERGCRCSLCLAQRARIAAGKLEAVNLVEAERARRQAAEAARWLADLRARYYGGRPCPRHAIPAPDCAACAANAGLTVTGAGEKARVPAETAPPDPAGEVEAALRDFDAWYAAGRGTLPEPEPVPAGMCRNCHLSPAVTSCPPGIASGLCFWCGLADTEAVRQENLGQAAAAGKTGTRPGVLPVIRAALVMIGLLIGVLIVTGVL